jgi:eukaryotic-like serine/threonine-protein kinase
MRERHSTERWRALIPHLDQVLDLEPDERQPWLSALREKDAALADDLQALVQRHEAIDEGFLADGPDAPVPVSSLAGQAAGAYVLRSQLGQGGMGTVWLAERSDGRYQGTAAVKVLNAALTGRAGEARFRREASILARLRHPHIAQLIDAGVSPLGQPYLVLERVDGERIDRYCDARNLPVEARIRVFLDVLAAVAHAHAQLIVHRDIKPSNVLVATDGQVKLLDFGVAKLLESDETGEPTVVTREGESALTPGYAAPEQLTGGDVTTATDVYALGVLLYLLLTGHHPARPQSSSPAELIRAIVDTEPARVSDGVGSQDPSEPSPLERAARRGSTPRKLRGTLRGDLDNIVAKALKKNPAERYASAEAMAEDLHRYLGHLPVRARADSLGYRTRKFVTRHRVVLSAAAAVVIALAVGAAVAVRQARVAAHQRDRALVELRRAESTIDFISYLLAEARPTEGKPITNAELLARGDAVIDARYANDPATRIHMLLMLADRYWENEQYDRWQATVERAFQASRGIADVGLRSRAACAKAGALVDQAPRDKEGLPDRLLAEAYADLATVPDAQADLAYCLREEAEIANGRGDPARALAAAERAVALEEARGAPAGRRFDAAQSLATAYLVAGRAEAADRAYRQLFAIIESQGLSQSRDATTVLHNWSAMWQNEGRHLRAVPLSERTVRIARERDTESGALAAFVRAYGMALCAVGRCREAVPLVEEGVVKARAGRSPRRIVLNLTAASGVYREVDDLGRAESTLREAEDLLASDPRASPHLHSLVERAWARLALARGDTAGAVRHAERALARQQAALPEEADTMKLEILLAECSNAHGDFKSARAAVGRAVPIATRMLDELKHSLHMGQSLLELGIALAGQGDPEAGRAEVRRAVEHLEASVGPDAAITRRAKARLAAESAPSGRK